jgi:hypothetical protein
MSTKTFEYDVNEVLHSLETIVRSDSAITELRKKYATDLNIIEASIKAKLIKDEAVQFILGLAPICYKIGDKVFLKGETKGKYDFIGDDMDEQTATELIDMTTEMTIGDSYSIYVSDTSYFPLASYKEMLEVKDFLDSL